MSQPNTNVRTIKLDKLSKILGTMIFVEMAQPYTNKRTGETTTKVTIHSSEQLEKYDVTVQGDLSKILANAKKGDEIDFTDVEFGHMAEIMNGWNDSKKGALTDVVKAVDVVFPVTKAKNN